MRREGSPERLLALAAAHPAFERAREAVTLPRPPVVPRRWVAEGAGRGFAAALLSVWRRSANPPKTGPLVVLAGNLREQEELFNSLSLWEEGAVFLPRLELASVPGALPDAEIVAERLDVIRRLADGEVRCLVATPGSFNEDLPAPDRLESARLNLAKGMTISPAELSRRLESAGLQSRDPVIDRGQFARRGGIIDIYPADRALPLRIEFFGDEIDSMREFDPDSQRATRHLDQVTILLDDFSGADDPEGRGTLADYLPEGCAVAATEAAGVSTTDFLFIEDPGHGADDPVFAPVVAYSSGGRLPGELVHSEAARRALGQQLRDWRGQGWEIWVLCATTGESDRLAELLGADAELLTFATGELRRGFLIPEARIAVLSDAELLGRYQVPSARRVGAASRRSGAPIDLSTLTEGDLVVHLDHGIGRYLGLREERPGSEELIIEYADEARLYVPLHQAHLVSRYTGIGRRQPPLSTLGDTRWDRAKEGVARSVESFAEKLLAVQAARETRRGHAFSPDKPWQIEFERAFPHRETPDQLRAIEETKRDMESPRPMDRLICGDVGFGKTEVAIRAAFKAVLDGKQVAMLVPTTVLAQQHCNTLRERLSDYPVRIGMLSRFSSKREIRETLAGLRDGSVDIVVGTHRLISADVEFKDLGLVIIDEEQRFGVRHKERLKAKFELVDQLTLSATPIPRTLYLSLVGARDMSTIETPPPNRYPVETVVCPYDERIIREALRREIERGGQVFFLHNRVGSINTVARRLAELCPGARIAVGHGQMEEGELEAVMRGFVAGECDVLVATTIIESGIDIPNANTIIIDRADRFGLADLYQLRGRVGRAHHKAYAYLMLPRDLTTTRGARKRVSAIRQYSSLGAGFRVAMRDLEIRGAGNILGTEQSGHVVTVGFDLYCSLLRRAIARLKGEEIGRGPELPVRIDFLSTNEGDHLARTSAGLPSFPAFLPGAFITSPPDRMAAYRDLAAAASIEAVEDLAASWRDRYGPLPVEAENLLAVARLKILAASRDIEAIEIREGRVMISRRGGFLKSGGKFPRLTSGDPAGSIRELADLITRNTR